MKSFCLLGACLIAAPLLSAQTFTSSNFVEETLYQGNGMISIAFDHAGRLYVNEKQGRVLQFSPNPNAGSFPVSYEYFENNGPVWNALPNFNTLTPVETGIISDFVLDPANRADDYGFRYTATLPISQAGTYTFYLASDDGSRLYIDNVLVVNHDGLHGASTVSATANLTAGNHALRVEYFERNGGQSLSVEFAGPGIARQRIASAFGDFLPPTVFLDITSQVNDDGERGMMGLALDPDFANNRYLYTLFATNTDQRLVRYTVNAAFNGIVAGSEKILLSGLPNTNTVHKAGDIAFHPNEPFTITIMLGDDGERYIVSDLNNYNGKILRVDSTSGEGLSDNPFYDGNPNSVRSRIWSYAYRNPFRFAFDPAAPIADVLYVSENGDGTDRIARIAKGADGGWPNAAFLNNSADGKRKILYTSSPSRTAIAIVRGGPFAPLGPAIYGARYGDPKEVRRWYLTGENLDTLTPFPEDMNGATHRAFLSGYSSFNIVSFKMGPDGAMYFTDSNQGASTGTGYRLGRIRHIGGTPPVAGFSASPGAVGNVPFTVQFTDSSTASTSDIVARSWDFGDGATSTATNPQHTYNQAGVYEVTMTVTNALGLVDTETTTITAYRAVTLNLTGQIRDARSLAAPLLAVPTELRFYQRDGVTPAAEPAPIPAGGVINHSVALQLTSDDVVISAGELVSDGLEPALAGLRLAPGATVSGNTNFHLSHTMLRGRITDTLGRPAPVDIGLGLGEPDGRYAMPNGRDYLIPPSSGVAHRVVADALGYFHLPIRLPDAGTTAFLDTGADTLTGVYAAVQHAVYVPARASRVVNLVTGLYDGGTGVNDLSGVAVTPNVNFATQIQPIFTAYCAACHSDIATNSGGLDLQAGVSFNELVGRVSTEAIGVKLVQPGSPERSYLMEKISSAQPQIGTRMRPNDPMSLANQALIRDWITQLAGQDQVAFSSAQFIQNEAATTVNATITLTRTGSGSGAASVTLATEPGGTATPGADFTATSATVTWQNGETGPKTATIPILGDTLAEATETVHLSLANATGALLGPVSTSRLAILDPPLAAWQAATFGTAAANTAAAQPDSDFEGDSASNLLEYGLDGDPLTPDLNWLTGEIGHSGNEITFDFPRNLAATDITWRILGAGELQTGAGGWSEVAAKTGAAAWSTIPGAAISEDPVTGIVRLTLEAETQRYLKLEVTR